FFLGCWDSVYGQDIRHAIWSRYNIIYPTIIIASFISINPKHIAFQCMSGSIDFLCLYSYTPEISKQIIFNLNLSSRTIDIRPDLIGLLGCFVWPYLSPILLRTHLISFWSVNLFNYQVARRQPPLSIGNRNRNITFDSLSRIRIRPGLQIILLTVFRQAILAALEVPGPICFVGRSRM